MERNEKYCILGIHKMASTRTQAVHYHMRVTNVTWLQHFGLQETRNNNFGLVGNWVRATVGWEGANASADLGFHNSMDYERLKGLCMCTVCIPHSVA